MHDLAPTTCTFTTTWGPCTFSWSEHGITQINIPSPTAQPAPQAALPSLAPAWCHTTIQLVRRFLAGQYVDFCEIPLDLHTMSEFAQHIYAATRAIPWGATQTYLQLAQKICAPQAARAVGQAMKRNPVPLLVPCHRVTATHSLGGFNAPGGLVTKRRLLALEQAVAAPLTSGVPTKQSQFG